MKIVLPPSDFNNPIPIEKLDQVFQLLEFESNDLVVDIGGGNGSVLLHLLDGRQAEAVLVERDPSLVEVCRKRAGHLVETKQLQLKAMDANDYLKELEIDSVDLFICIGSSYALGGYTASIEKLSPFLKPGGYILIGEEYWKQAPAQDYLDVLGGTVDESRMNHENISVPEKMGFNYLYSVVASEDDWNRFEGKYFLEEEMKASLLDPESRNKKLAGIRAFRNAQYQFGRTTMGFGLYLFQKSNQT